MEDTEALGQSGLGGQLCAAYDADEELFFFQWQRLGYRFICFDLEQLVLSMAGITFVAAYLPGLRIRFPAGLMMHAILRRVSLLHMGNA